MSEQFEEETNPTLEQLAKKYPQTYAKIMGMLTNPNLAESYFAETKNLALQSCKESPVPGPDETAAINLEGKWKTAALCYDRVWYPFVYTIENIPESVRFAIGTPAEIDFAVIITMVSFAKKFLPNGEIPLHLLEIIDAYENQLGKTAMQKQGIGATMARSIANDLQLQLGRPVTPVYENKKDHQEAYKEGKHDVVVASISDLGLVDEDQLSWEQVLEFRKDTEARNKYRRLIHWLDKDMVDKSQGFITDEIAQKLEDYEWAIEKHGLKTRLGKIYDVLDGKFLMGAAGAGGPFILADHPTLGILISAGIVLGKVAVKLTENCVDLKDIERGTNSEIAFIHEIKKLGQ